MFPPLLCSYLTQAGVLSPFLRHRSINLFLLAYQRIWIETEEYSFEEKLVQDLAVSTCVVHQFPPPALESWASPPQHLLPVLVSLLKSAWKHPPPPHVPLALSLSHPQSKHDIITDVRASWCILTTALHPTFSKGASYHDASTYWNFWKFWCLEFSKIITIMFWVCIEGKNCSMLLLSLHLHRRASKILDFVAHDNL